MTDPTPLLTMLDVADEPGAWVAAGFRVDGNQVALGLTRIRLVGGDGGVDAAAVAGIEVGDHLDGLAVRVDDVPGPGRVDPVEAHPNGTIGLDHVVVASPDLDRTVDAFEAVGVACRRIRETDTYGRPMRQAFFRFGPTIVEVVGGASGRRRPVEEAPSTWFGLAVTVTDLDATADVLGEGLGRIKAAVQDDQRIATFRHRHFGVSVPIAAMDHHRDRVAS